MLNLFAFGFVLLDCGYGLNVALGVKASLTLGREEKPWVKGKLAFTMKLRNPSLGEGIVFLEYGLH